MENVLAFGLLVVGTLIGLSGLGAAAITWGVDSRPGLLDDHTR
jgi:ABC-type proline/glycine betaine transport system permease subunit